MTERLYTHGDLLAEEKVFDANGHYRYSLFFAYNDKRQLIRETDPIGQVSVYHYDENGNKIFEEKIGSGKKTKSVFDKANRLVQETEEHENGRILTTSHSYDSMNNRICTTNHLGQETAFQYDSAHREVRRTDPLGQAVYKEYDTHGRITKKIDQDGYAACTSYNLYGDPLEITYPDGSTKQFSYNLQGHLIQEWERDGRTVTYEVDYKGRPIYQRSYDQTGKFFKCVQK